MSYTPKTWGTGDRVRTTDLNHIEQGIANAGSALIATVSLVNNVQTLDKTVQEIYDAMTSGTPVYLKYAYGVASDYTSHTSLAPITNIFTYDSTNLIRVAINMPMYSPQSISGQYNLYRPTVYVFQASGMNSYPTFLRAVQPSLGTTEATTSFL